MEVFHVGDKVFLDNRGNIRPRKYGKIINIDTQNNLMVVSLIDDDIPFYININSSKIKKIGFFPKDHVIIHDLLKDYCNKKGIVDAYDRTIDRYRVMIDNDSEPHWFAPFELTLADNDKDNDDCKDNDDWSEHFINFSSSNLIKVTLSDKGKRAYKYYFGTNPSVDADGRTKFISLAQFMKTFFIYGDKYNYMLEDDEILIKVDD